MHLIDGPGATDDNRFTEGNPAAGVAPTQVTADFMNMLQTELLNVLNAAGKTPEKADNTQLVDSILDLIVLYAPAPGHASTTAAGIVELSTDEEAIAGTDAERGVSPHNLAAVLAALGALTKVKGVSLTRDMTLASGTQSITGVGFTPRAALCVAGVSNASKMSIGFATESLSACVSDNHSSVSNSWAMLPSYFAWTVQGSGNGYGGALAFNSDGGTITWTKVGTTTETLAVHILFIG